MKKFVLTTFTEVVDIFSVLTSENEPIYRAKRTPAADFLYSRFSMARNTFRDIRHSAGEQKQVSEELEAA